MRKPTAKNKYRTERQAFADAFDAHGYVRRGPSQEGRYKQKMTENDRLEIALSEEAAAAGEFDMSDDVWEQRCAQERKRRHIKYYLSRHGGKRVVRARSEY